jgi:hypothetical protein
MAAPPNTRTVAMWRLRADLSLTRWLVTAAAVAGIGATVRLTLAPPSPPAPRTPTGRVTDLAAEGFAEQFARTLLTYDSSRPDARRRALASFAGDGLDPDAGLVPPPSGSQQVQWARVVQQRDPRPGEHVYTVAAQTDRSGLLHVAVDVAHDRNGTLRLGGYPALVGAPASAPVTRDPDERLSDVDDDGLRNVVTRALRNYLGLDAGQLIADLAPGARVTIPDVPVRMTALEDLKWAVSGGSVLATVTANGSGGAQWRLRYELDMRSSAGRWEVTAIETRPDG